MRILEKYFAIIAKAPNGIEALAIDDKHYIVKPFEEERVLNFINRLFE